jgi:hypothetical protein
MEWRFGNWRKAWLCIYVMEWLFWQLSLEIIPKGFEVHTQRQCSSYVLLTLSRSIERVVLNFSKAFLMGGVTIPFYDSCSRNMKRKTIVSRQTKTRGMCLLGRLNCNKDITLLDSDIEQGPFHSIFCLVKL